MEGTEDTGPTWYLGTKHKVFYDANKATSGAVPVDNMLYASDDTITVLGNINDLERDGYHFDDWNTAKDGTGISYKAGETLEIDKTLILYAQWKHNPVTVSFVTNSDTTIDPITIDYGATITKPEDIVNKGFTFEGWFIDSEFNEAFDFDTPIVEDITLYAKWTKIIDPVDPDPTDPTVPTEPTVPTKPELPGTGISKDYIGLLYLVLGGLVICSNRKKEE